MIIHLTGSDPIPESLWSNTEVDHLILGDMGLDSLDERIGDLTTLSRLQLPRNNLSVLPERLGELSKLHTLGLAFNNFISMPTILFSMNIRTLCIEGNPMESNLSSMTIPESVEILLVSGGTRVPASFTGLAGTLSLVR